MAIIRPSMAPKIAPDQGLLVAPQQGPSAVFRLLKRPSSQPSPPPMAAPMIK